MTQRKQHVFTTADIEPRIGSGYPPPFNEISPTRSKWAVGDRAGLNHFGVNVVNLPPGDGSAQRHWHENEDEFVYVVSGELVLVTDDGEETMGPGDMAGFPAGIENGHHLVNRSDADAVFLEIGTRAEHDVCHYPDIDMRAKQRNNDAVFTKKNGDPID